LNTKFMPKTQVIFNRRIIFDHLPKTAGQAVNTWLSRVFGPATVTESLIGDHRDLIQTHGGNFNIISGHVSFRGDGLDPRYGYLTCLREPIDRAISWLFFVNKNFDNSVLPGVWEKVDRFIRSDGEDMDDEVKDHLENLYVNHFSSIISTCPTSNDDQKLEDAFLAISHYDVVGVYEYLDDFANDVVEFLNIANPPPIESVNVTVTRPRVNHISDRLRQRLIALNQLDIKFYHALKERKENARTLQKHSSAKSTTMSWIPYWRPELSIINMGHAVNALDNQEYPSEIKLIAYLTLSGPVTKLNTLINVYDHEKALILNLSSSVEEQSLYQLKAGFYEMQFSIKNHLPAGDYQISLIFLNEHVKAHHEMAWHSLAINIPQKSTLDDEPKKIVRKTKVKPQHPSLNITYEYFNEAVAQKIDNALGSITCNIPLTEVKSATSFTLDVNVSNQSPTNWMGSLKNPIHLSYRWMNANNEVVIFEGERTPLPCMCLFTGESIEVQMFIISPEVPGSYQLALVPVQECVAWLDSKGFKPLVLTINVIE